MGNFGDGHINAFDATTGASLGQLKDPDGEPIGSTGCGRCRSATAAPAATPALSTSPPASFDESHGLFGSLTTVAPGTPEGPAEAQMVQAASTWSRST